MKHFRRHRPTILPTLKAVCRKYNDYFVEAFLLVSVQSLREREGVREREREIERGRKRVKDQASVNMEYHVFSFSLE